MPGDVAPSPGGVRCVDGRNAPNLTTHEKFGRLDTQFARELLDYIHGGGILAALKAADVGPVDFGTVGKLFLRQSRCRPVPFQIFRQDLA